MDQSTEEQIEALVGYSDFIGPIIAATAGTLTIAVDGRGHVSDHEGTIR